MQVRFIIFLCAQEYNLQGQEFEGKIRFKIQTELKASVIHRSAD